ncbi:MAG TPA: thioredoxin family protein [Vicinamibacterales bacterium]|nr:thioredoxin family protein [Vicinamibacterales bacterium]
MQVISLFLLLVVSPLQTGSVDPARLFEAGETWERFLERVERQRERWLRTAAVATVAPDLVERVQRARRDLKLLVVAEDWCPDSAYSVPYVARLMSLAHVPFRIVDRATGESLLRAHRTFDGRTATPTVVLLREGVDVGAWVERPTELQDLFRSIGADPESARRFAQRGDWYEADRGVTVLKEIVAVVEQTGAAK